MRDLCTILALFACLLIGMGVMAWMAWVAQ